jgi:hypothetical protein
LELAVAGIFNVKGLGKDAVQLQPKAKYTSKLELEVKVTYTASKTALFEVPTYESVLPL